MGWLTDVAPDVARTGAPWLLVFLLVVWYVRSMRRGFDEKIGLIRAHNAELVKMVREQQAAEARRADLIDQILPVLHTVETLVRALPAGESSRT